MKVAHEYVESKRLVSHIYKNMAGETDSDYLIAMMLQKEWETEDNANSDEVEIIDESNSYHIDIHQKFQEFDMLYFDSSLKSVVVKWSNRMTLCAGLCCYEGKNGLCTIKLSEPLLQFRPQSDLIDTLLHEMIHAFLFVKSNRRDRTAHGPDFIWHMKRINLIAKTNITVFHSFHDEVSHFRRHWWKCDGPCQNRSPFYSVVKRAMNRAPGPTDYWWSEHQLSCSGKFYKIKEPPEVSKKAIEKKMKSKLKEGYCKIENFYKKESTT